MKNLGPDLFLRLSPSPLSQRDHRNHLAAAFGEGHEERILLYNSDPLVTIPCDTTPQPGGIISRFHEPLRSVEATLKSVKSP